jgi:hypothetical protein
MTPPLRTPFSVGLQAGFGSSLAADVDAIASYGFQVVRQDVYGRNVYDPALVTELAGAPVHAVFLIGGGSIAIADGSRRLEPFELAQMTTAVVEAANSVDFHTYAIEIGNEPDIAHPDYANHPEDFAEAVRECHFAARVADFRGPVISGGIANLNDRGFRYLRRMLACDALPLDDLVIGFHRYPEANRGPFAPHDRYTSRADEWDTFAGLVGDRPVACTEFGYQTADVLDDAEVAAAVLWDLDFYEARGVQLAVVYQLTDGPTDTWIDRYGVRRSDGSWKPVAEAVRDRQTRKRGG